MFGELIVNATKFVENTVFFDRYFVSIIALMVSKSASE